MLGMKSEQLLLHQITPGNMQRIAKAKNIWAEIREENTGDTTNMTVCISCPAGITALSQCPKQQVAWDCKDPLKYSRFQLALFIVQKKPFNLPFSLLKATGSKKSLKKILRFPA